MDNRTMIEFSDGSRMVKEENTRVSLDEINFNLKIQDGLYLDKANGVLYVITFDRASTYAPYTHLKYIKPFYIGLKRNTSCYSRYSLVGTRVDYVQDFTINNRTDAIYKDDVKNIDFSQFEFLTDETKHTNNELHSFYDKIRNCI